MKVLKCTVHIELTISEMLVFIRAPVKKSNMAEFCQE